MAVITFFNYQLTIMRWNSDEPRWGQLSICERDFTLSKCFSRFSEVNPAGGGIRCFIARMVLQNYFTQFWGDKLIKCFRIICMDLIQFARQNNYFFMTTRVTSSFDLEWCGLNESQWGSLRVFDTCFRSFLRLFYGMAVFSWCFPSPFENIAHTNVLHKWNANHCIVIIVIYIGNIKYLFIKTLVIKNIDYQ